ncbi:HVA22 protein i [Spatholobus suberectus]|nr:HVA22 protein i [Spatholobus suberectus]
MPLTDFLEKLPEGEKTLARSHFQSLPSSFNAGLIAEETIPNVAKHETEIDRNLLKLRTRTGDIIVLYWQKAASYGQTRIFDILLYVAAQSTPSPRPAQVVVEHVLVCLL